MVIYLLPDSQDHKLSPLVSFHIQNIFPLTNVGVFHYVALQTFITFNWFRWALHNFLSLMLEHISADSIKMDHICHPEKI